MGWLQRKFHIFKPNALVEKIKFHCFLKVFFKGLLDWTKRTKPRDPSSSFRLPLVSIPFLESEKRSQSL